MIKKAITLGVSKVNVNTECQLYFQAATRKYIEEGKDLVSLITCTPYGLNTHRLVVTGERTEYEPAIYENIESKNMSIREYVFLAIPFVFLTIILGRRINSVSKKA